MTTLKKSIVDNVNVDPKKRVIVWDNKITGFGLLVLPSGVKSYIFDYRTLEGRKRRATIGKHGTWTTEQARKEAQRLSDTVKAGHDPLADRKVKRETPTLAEVLSAYMASEEFNAKAETTKPIDRSRITHHLLPVLGHVLVNKLTVEDLTKARKDIEDGRTAVRIQTKRYGLARVTGGAGTAKKALRLLGTALKWARAQPQWRGYTIENPVPLLRFPPDGRRTAILESPAEYARLFVVLKEMEEERAIRGPVAAAIKIIALTGCRRSEVLRMRWKHIDLKKGVVRLPPDQHKAGHSTGEDRVIGLPSLAQTIIAEQAPATEPDPDALVFLPVNGKGAMNINKPWREVRQRAGLPDDLGLHGLRHSLASTMAMEGAQAAAIQAALGHKDITTSARYVHWAQDRHQALAEDAARMISNAMRTAQGDAPAEVVPLKQK